MGRNITLSVGLVRVDGPDPTRYTTSMKYHGDYDMKKATSTSKLLSLVLRHKPEAIGLTLDSEGWANVTDLIQKINRNSEIEINFDELCQTVATSDKQRFAFNKNKTKIRANQGHSIDVNLNLVPVEPPKILYHGTGRKNVDSIFASGIDRRNRQHVHLSADTETATKVGGRHGKPVVLVVDSQKMHQDGYEFVLSKNGVWLTDNVPSKYISFNSLGQE